MFMSSQIQDGKKKTLKDKVIIILDELDFSWYPWEIEKAIKLWDSGLDIITMAEILRPDSPQDAIDEVFMLLLHLAREGQICEREGKLFGRDYKRDSRDIPTRQRLKIVI